MKIGTAGQCEGVDGFFVDQRELVRVVLCLWLLGEPCPEVADVALKLRIVDDIDLLADLGGGPPARVECPALC